jgi:hypothetical protein
MNKRTRSSSTPAMVRLDSLTRSLTHYRLSGRKEDDQILQESQTVRFGRKVRLSDLAGKSDCLIWQESQIVKVGRKVRMYQVCK